MRTINVNLLGSADLFSIIRNLVLLIAIYCYFIGWLYAYYLFYAFGISLNAVDIPFYYFFMYSYSVLANPLKMLVLIIVAILLLVAYFHLPSWINRLAIPVVLAASFLLAFYAAHHEASQEAWRKRRGYAKTISFVFTKNARSVYPNTLLRANSNGRLRLLTQTRDRYFVFYQPSGESPELPYGFSYDIQASHVLLATVEFQ